MTEKDRYVVNHPDGWAVKKPGAERASGVFDTQREAEQKAKEIVHNNGGGEVRIQNRQGQWRDSDTVAPGNDPNPPRDKKHLGAHMKEEIRRAVVFAALSKINNQPPSSIYSYAQAHHTSMSGSSSGFYDFEAGAHVSMSGSSLYHFGLGHHVSLNIDGNQFSGYDFGSGSHFQGSLNGRAVQLYDFQESTFFNYQG